MGTPLTQPEVLTGADQSSCARLERVTEMICRPLRRPAGGLWWTGMAVFLILLASGTAAVIYQLTTGLGTWGLDHSVGWGIAITNFVFWIGIGHAGTFISAILFLSRQEWRSSISRLAEASTLLAVVCAAIFPIIHLGRPLLAYWMLPYPNWRGPLWINFRSPLVWDFFAIAAYLSLSALFFYVGLLPDLARLRETGPRKKLGAWLSRGWDYSLPTWRAYRSLYLVLASLATVLVISVHSIVSLDFAVTIVPGWHTTVFPPFFVVGAVFSGLAMVTLLTLGVRHFYGLDEYITLDHLERIGRLILAGACFIGFIYAIEVAHVWRAGHPIEHFVVHDRLAGAMQLPFLLMVVFNVVAPQVLWWKAARRNRFILAGIAILILCGMWLERFVIVVGSLQRDHLPSSWTEYTPTLIEAATLAGTVGLFGTGFLIFCRLFPVLPMHEIKAQCWDRQDSTDVAPGEISDVKGGSAGFARVGQRSIRLTARFDSGKALVSGVNWVRAKGWRISRLESPFPIEELLGPETRGWLQLPRLAFVLVLLTAVVTFAFQSWASALDWPLNVGGRPLVSSPAFIPVSFELAIFTAGLLTFLLFSVFHLRRRDCLRPLGDAFRLTIEVNRAGTPGETEEFRQLTTGLEDEERWEQ